MPASLYACSASTMHVNWFSPLAFLLCWLAAACWRTNHCLQCPKQRVCLLWSCRQLRGLQEQSKLADEAAAEAAAEVAKLQENNAHLSLRLQQEEQQHKSAAHEAAADTHRQQMLVSAETTKPPVCRTFSTSHHRLLKKLFQETQSVH